MAVDANSYGTVARVEARVGDMVEARTFSVSTVPTLAQVENLIDDTAARVNAELRAQGYTVPVDNSGTDVEAFAWLRAANSAAAAATILNTVPGESLDPDIPDEIRIRRQGLWGEYMAVIKMIQAGEFPATRTVTSQVTKAFSGSQEDNDSNPTTPVFTRERTSFPGVWPS